MPSAHQQDTPCAILIMGVSGAGKTTIGIALAKALGATFLDADDFHPPENRRKMSSGIPLDDTDRAPWLAAICQRINSGESIVLACSALKEIYRHTLRAARPDLRIIFLTASGEILLHRLANRSNHFMPASLLDSQLSTLEPPIDCITIDATLPLPDILNDIKNHLKNAS